METIRTVLAFKDINGNLHESEIAALNANARIKKDSRERTLTAVFHAAIPYTDEYFMDRHSKNLTIRYMVQDWQRIRDELNKVEQ